MKISQVLAAALAAGSMAMVGCGGSDDAACGDAGCSDAGSVDAAVDSGVTAPPYIPMSGMYQVVSYMEIENGCQIPWTTLTNSVDPLDWLPVTVTGTSIKIGNPKGTPPVASLGEGTLIGAVSPLARMSHLQNMAPSMCEYDELVAASISLDDPTSKTIGLSERWSDTNRTMCSDPVGVGASCQTTWSWRLTYKGPLQ